MKRIFLLVFMSLILTSCNVDDYKIKNCFGEYLYVDISYSKPIENPKKVNFVVEYDGTYTLKNEVKWSYGDGTEQTTTTRASHTYAEAGNYTAIATITLTNQSCVFDIPVEVIVE